MKKILILCGLAVCMLAGCTQSRIVNPTEVEGEPEYDLDTIGDELNKKYTGNEEYPGVEIAFRIDGGTGDADFGLVVKTGTTSEEAADYAQAVLKAFNDLMAEQDSNIKKSESGYLGGFYEDYLTAVKVSTEDKKSESDDWLVDMVITDPAEDIISIEEEKKILESESLAEEATLDGDQDVEHGPGTVPTEPAVIESKPGS